MSNILLNDPETASAYIKRIQSELKTPLKPILASQVIAEVQKRCSNGLQYTTFPNTITAVEKSKLISLGYIVTENTISTDNRDGAGDMYIGFQVALNDKAVDKAMNISQKETNGIGG